MWKKLLPMNSLNEKPYRTFWYEKLKFHFLFTHNQQKSKQKDNLEHSETP